jgi:hypothetical protein
VIGVFPEAKQAKSGLLVLENVKDLAGNVVFMQDVSGEPKKKMAALDNLLNIYWRDIIAISPENLKIRIRKIKELMQAGHKNFQWPEQAIIHGCAQSDIFQQFYREKFPHNRDMASHRVLPPSHQIEKTENPEAEKIAKAELEKMKSLFP